MVLATGATVASSRGDVRDATARDNSDQQQDGHAANGNGGAYQTEGDGDVQQPDEDDEVALFFVEAVYPYRGQEANHLNFDKRDLIEVWGQDATGWWDGFLVQSTLDDHRGKRGWFPSNYVKRLPDDAGESIRRMLEAQQATAATTPLTANAADFTSSHSSPVANHRGHQYATGETTANIDSLLGVSDSSVLSGASLDMLLGRRGGNFDPTDLDSVLRGSRSSGSGSLGGSKRDMADRTIVPMPAADARESDLDLTSFSAGDGDIFSEIAAAAAADHRFSSLSMSSSENGDSQDHHSPEHGAAAAGSLLPPVEIADGRSQTGALPSTSANASIDPDWLPKVSPTGRVYYYNTRTGRTAFELSSPTETSSLVSGSAGVKVHGRSDSGTAGSESGSAPHTAKGRSVPGVGSAPLLSHQSSNYEEVLDSSVTSQNDLSTLRPADGRANGRPDTMYSDDSALDADLSPARGGTASTLVSGSIASIDTANTGFGPRKYAVASSSQQSLVMTPDSSTREDIEPSRLRLSAIVAATASRANPTIAELEKDVTEALAALSSAVQKKAIDPGRGGTNASLRSDAANRQHLEQAAASLSRASRHLLSATDVMLEQASVHSRRTSNASSIDKGARASLASFSMTQAVADSKEAAGLRTLPTLSGTEFRPLAMKITATESKLLLSVRTTWGLLDTSAEEEAAVNISRSAENLTEEDMTVLKEQRATLLSARREIDAKLRYDLLVQIRTLGDHVTAFVEAVETYASRKGLSVRKDALAAPRPILASFPASPASILFPPSVVAGVLRGHGWSSRAAAGVALKRSSLTPSTLHFPASARESWRTSEPSRPLTSSTLESLRSSRGVLLDDLGALRTILQTLLGSQSAMVRLKPSLLPTVTTQALQLANRLARLMRDVEDVDIAGRLDIPLDLETYISLTGEDLESVAASGIFGSSSDQLAPVKAGYEAALHKAASLLGELGRAKEELLGIVPDILSIMQRLSALAAPAPSAPQGSPHRKAAAPFHPPALSPLSSFTTSAFSSSTTSSIVAALEGVEPATSRLLSTFTSLVALADEQAAAPATLRRPNVALRAVLANALAPESALSSNARYSVRHRYRRVSRPNSGVLGLEDENAEELDSASGPGHAQVVFATPGRNGADQRSHEASGGQSMQRTSSAQSALLRGVVGRASRSNSVAESFASDVSKGSSYAKRDAQEDLRNAMQEAGIANNSSPTNHSPSKSKLKQFFGADAPGQTIHRPPTANRDVTPTFLQPDYSHDQISYANDGSIRAGTLHALVCRMTNHMSADRAYNDAFLMTYRTFCTSQQLLDLLKQRYNLEPPAGIRADEYKLWVDQKQKLVRIRVIGALRSWITDYLYDDDDALLDQVSAFAVILPSEPSQQLARIIERRKITGAPRRLTASVSAGTAPPPVVPRNLKKIKFLDVEPLEIARQLTILDSRLFSKITVDECLSKAWPKKFNNRDMPNFKAIAEMSNAVTGWVAMTIVTQPDLRRRAAIIKHFIAIADKCRALHNFQTLMQIVAGLNSGAIYRLKRTWELVNQRSMSTLTYLGNLMSPENNHALYRDALRLVGSPCVPFLGVYFTDWVMSGEANSDMLRDKPDQINFAKRARVAESIQQIQMNQATPYNLAAVPALIKWINQELNIGATPTAGSKEQNGYGTVSSSPLASLVGMASTPSPGPGSAASSVMDVTSKSPSPAVDMMTKAYDLSLRIEPRERDDERIARLLSESGFL